MPRIFLLFVCFGAIALEVLTEQVLLKDERTSFILTGPTEQGNADQAFRICEALFGMVPVSIISAKKNKEVTEFMAAYDIGSVWTSGDDLSRRNNYEWNLNEYTTIPFEYTNWLDGAPLENESYRCVAFVSGVHSSCGDQVKCSGWTVEPCSERRRVLCEFPIPI